MSFKISIIQGRPNFESLHVAKITDYPLEPRDYKPFAQCRLCADSEGFIIRMWAFESAPDTGSKLRACFNLLPGESDKIIDIQINPRHNLDAGIVESGRPENRDRLDGVKLERFDGEDLQGVYWGATATIPHNVIKDIYGGFEFTKGHRITGNMYKISDDKGKEHYGSFYRTDFKSENPYSEKYFGDFELVKY